MGIRIMVITEEITIIVTVTVIMLLLLVLFQIDINIIQPNRKKFKTCKCGGCYVLRLKKSESNLRLGLKCRYCGSPTTIYED